MRRTVFLAATLSAAFAPAAAHAATLPPASEPGVSVARTSGGAFTITFTPAAYRGIAGRRLTIDCTSSRELSPVAAAPKSFLTRLTTPRKPAPIRIRPRAGTDVCAFSEASHNGDLLVALGQHARRFIADATTATDIGQLVLTVTALAHTHASWPTYGDLPKRLRGQIAHLASPGATPRGRAYGYYSDGRRSMAIAGVSASGRRLSFSIDGEDATSNIVGVLNTLGTQTAPTGTLPVGAFPPAGTPLPDATVNGVTATQTGGQVDVAFSGSDAEAAYSQLAGKRVLATCTRTAEPILGIALQRPPATFALVAPDQPSTLHLDFASGTYSACTLSVAAGSPIVQVAVGEAGRTALADGLTMQALDAVARRAAGAGGGAYVSASDLSSAFAGAVVELGAPADTPVDRRVGVYSKGTHLAVVATSLTGRRLYEDVSGDVVRTNLQSITSLTSLF